MPKSSKGKKKPGVVSPARPPRQCAIPKADRVQEIVELMIANQWQPSRRFELAEKWGIGPDAVQACSAEAHRIAQGYYPTPDESRVTVINDLNEAIAMAKEMRMPGEIIKGAMGMAKVTGCEAPQKVAITDSKGEDIPPYMQRSWPSEVWAWVGAEAAKGHAATEAEMVAYQESLASK